jgi:catechol-2,3-dioxygenase
MVDSFAELTPETRDPALLESFYLEDPEGNVVAVWDFFTRRDGSREGMGALP